MGSAEGARRDDLSLRLSALFVCAIMHTFVKIIGHTAIPESPSYLGFLIALP